MTEHQPSAQAADDAQYERNQRIERILDVLAEIVRGNYSERIAPEDSDDPLIEVESAINLVLEELSLSRSLQEQQAGELAQKNRDIAEQQQRLLSVLSTPILNVWPGVLALPIIGPVNKERQAVIMDAMLRAIMRQRASHIVLDLTGVDDPDAETAEFFVSAAKTVRLLGAQCMLSGIKPALAQALVYLDTEVHEVPIVAKTSDAIARILRARA